MKMMRKITLSATLIAGLSAIAAAQTPLGTAITYQGQLKNAGDPADGNFVMQFSLWNALSGGLQVGPTLTFDGAGGNPPPVAVTEGLFTVALDFGSGANVFNSDARWLQISVNATTLTPRQPITAAPYALRASSVTGIDGYSLDAADGSPVDALRTDNDGNIGILRNQYLGYDLADSFTHDTPPRTMGHYGLGWFNDSSNPSGSTAWLSGWGGMKFFTQGTPRVAITQGGNVGIGTTTPSRPLTVQGTGVNSDAIQLRKSSGQDKWHLALSGDGLDFVESGVAGNRLFLAPGGNVGIGTSTPATKLTVDTPADASTIITVDSGVSAPQFSGVNFGDRGQWEWAIGKDDVNEFYVNHAAGGRRLTIKQNGNVGIGTLNPNFRLTVQGTGTNSDAMQFKNAAGENKWHLSLTNNGLDFVETGQAANRLYLAPGGNVGIGTAAPETALHVARQPATASGTLALEGATHTFMSFYPNGSAAGRKGYLGFGGAGSPSLALVNEFSGGHIHLVTRDGGRTIVNVLEIFGGSDIAEPFDVSGDDKIEPGTVVCIDPANPGKLRVCRTAFDRTVAGIISGAGGVNTGMMLRQDGAIADGEHPVALTGRVYCHVDADAGGAVQPGDMLTTSDTPGHAMKAGDPALASGAILGKAMTSLESGKGLVLVLVSLQ